MNYTFDFANLILAAIAVASIAVPCVTAYLNNKTQIKLQQIELTYNKKVEAYRLWCDYASQFMSCCFPTETNTLYFEFLKSGQPAILFANIDTFCAMSEFADKCKEVVLKKNSSNNHLDTLIPLFNIVIQNMNKEIDNTQLSYNSKHNNRKDCP